MSRDENTLILGLRELGRGLPVFADQLTVTEGGHGVQEAVDGGLIEGGREGGRGG